MEVTPKAAEPNPVIYSPPPPAAEGSPREHKEEKHHQLSSSLRERLKRSRRSFTSPLSSVAKRLCVDEKVEDKNGQQVSADSPETVKYPSSTLPDVDVNRHEKSRSEAFSRPISEATRHPPKDLAQQRDRLRREVKDKMETLRRLKMVKMYRNKNDLAHLQTLVDKWRRCAQAALYELMSDVPIEGGKASLSALIDLFGLDDAILHFNRAEEDFTT
ncbi:swi5-dependent recombination DNA repair protein 1 homolog [Spinachia spinachia]